MVKKKRFPESKGNGKYLNLTLIARDKLRKSEQARLSALHWVWNTSQISVTEREVLRFVHPHTEKARRCSASTKDHVFCDGIKLAKEILSEIILPSLRMTKIWKTEIYVNTWNAQQLLVKEVLWRSTSRISNTHLIWIFSSWYVIFKVSLRGEFLSFDEARSVAVNAGGRKRLRWINLPPFRKFV